MRSRLASEAYETKSDGKARAVAEIKADAKRLGNTPAVFKKSYIHPGVIDEFLANDALELGERTAKNVRPDASYALSADESRVLAFIEKLGTRHDKKHLGELLAKSVRSARTQRRGSLVRSTKAG
jgi:DNA topoisomerase-1